MSLWFDSPGFLLTSLGCLSLFVSRSASQFGDELAAVEADGPYSHPPALDADVAGLDVPFADSGLRLALGGVGAEVVGLKSHLRSTINGVGLWHRCFFRKTNGVHLKLSSLLNGKGESVWFHCMLRGLDMGLSEVYNSTSVLVGQGDFVALGSTRDYA
jgi:hypothetical protein